MRRKRSRRSRRRRKKTETLEVRENCYETACGKLQEKEEKKQKGRKNCATTE